MLQNSSPVIKKTILIHTSAAEIIQLNPTVEYSCHQHQ